MNEQTNRIELSAWQIENLARPLVGMLSVMENFFKDPQNERAYREWYFKRYGKYPKDEVKQ